ncbi:MAG: hypothetical protein K0R03_1226 [Moraxellaceae bacterium]|jgi:hypothetical protein|nr:hypothetical protein [Moraxellaceae bacterium]
MRSSLQWSVAGLGALLLATAAQAGEDTRFVADAEVTLTHDSNISRAERERDILPDQGALVAGGVTLLTEPSATTALNLRAFVEGEAWLDSEPLNRSTGGGQVVGRWKPNPGFLAPTYQMTLTAQLDDYGVDQRDSTVYSAQVFASRRLTDRVLFTYGLEGVERHSDGTVFDVAHGRIFMNADFELNASWSAYGAWSYLRGDTFSSAQFTFCNGASATDIFGLINASEALESDEGLNEAYCGSWIAYRVPAGTHSFTAGLNHAINHSLSVDISAQDVRVHAKGDNDYRRLLLRAGLLMRF